MKKFRTIELKKEQENIKIVYERIQPFFNICKVTGEGETCNVKIEYIPSGKVLDIVSYREYFKQKFNLLIEEIAIQVYKDIKEAISPKYLKVQLFLEGNSHLSDWSVTIEK